MEINSFDEKNILLSLTPEQRHHIYEEEKLRIEQNSQALFKKYLLYFFLYILGCFLIYFGILNSLLDLFQTGKWIYQPETDFFENLFNSIIELIRPILAIVILSWPIMLIYGLWIYGDEIYKKILKKLNSHK